MNNSMNRQIGREIIQRQAKKIEALEREKFRLLGENRDLKSRLKNKFTNFPAIEMK